MNMLIPHTGRRRGLAVSALFYTGALTLIVFWPSPVDTGSAGMIRTTLAALHSLGIPERVDYSVVEWTANVGLFVPFGLFCAALLTRRFVWLAAVAGLAASCSIETVQHLLLPARYASVHDVLANSLGAALGAVAVYDTRRRRNAARLRAAILPRS